MATYYWVGGSGTWDNASNTNWSASSGGAGGAGVPNNTDTARFDANSGTAATVTVASTAACASCVVNKSDITLSLSGNATLSATGGTFSFVTGTITLNNNTLTLWLFNSDYTTARTINFGTGKIIVAGNNGAVWSCGDLSAMTYTGTPTVDATYSGATGTRTISNGSTVGGSLAKAINLNVTAGTDIVTLTNNALNAFNNLDFTGFAGTLSNSAYSIYGNLTLSTGMTITGGTGITTFAGTSGPYTITSNGKTYDRPVTFNGVGGTWALQDNMTVGSTRTVTLSNSTLNLNNNTLSTGLFSASNTAIRAIAFGTGNITVTGNAATVWSFGTVTNFSYTGTPTVNLTYSGGTGTRTVAHGSTGGGVEANSLSFFVSAGTDTVSFTGRARVLSFSGFSGTLSNSARTIYGNLTISSGMTLTAGTSATTFAGTSGTQQITTAGKTLDFPLTFNGIGGTFAFADAMTQGSTRAFTITNGTVQLKDGVTSTVGSFATSGINQKFLQSTLAGSQATLSQASGTVNASYLTIKDINATGGATWQAFVTNQNVDAGNNAGWDFYAQQGRYIYNVRKNKRILL